MLQKRVSLNNYFLIAGALSTLSIFGILFTKKFLPPVIPLLYGKPVGSDQLATTWLILIIPFTSLLITGINLLVNKSTKDEFIKHVSTFSSLIISILAVVAVIKIISLVGFF